MNTMVNWNNMAVDTLLLLTSCKLTNVASRLTFQNCTFKKLFLEYPENLWLSQKFTEP